LRCAAVICSLCGVPYPPRIEVVGSYYHVNSKSVDGAKLFKSEEDRLAFLRLLDTEVRRSGWQCLAYCLMSTHYHLLLRLRKCTLSSGMQHLNGCYARAFNRTHGRRGALFQRRYFDRLIETNSHLLEATRYIARNAPRAGLSPAPEDYFWCSYGATVVGDAPDPLIDEDELLGLFGMGREEARRNLRAFVDEPDPRKRRSQTPL
jgi:REP element-mobilizing transposase RayT